VALAFKKNDPKHLVALGNGDASFLDSAAKVCKDIDALAIILYRGKSFGNLFNNIRRFYDKPIILSEFGCDSYDALKNAENQDIQAEFLTDQWKDLFANTVYSQNNKASNCLGGVVFEWTDEWWKHDEGYRPDWDVHNTEAGWSEGSYYFDIKAPSNLNMNEEWFGLVSISPDLEKGVNKRVPKKAYTALKDFFSSIAGQTVSLPKKSKIDSQALATAAPAVSTAVSNSTGTSVK
jgi:hypothetical protein